MISKYRYKSGVCWECWDTNNLTIKETRKTYFDETFNKHQMVIIQVLIVIWC